MKEFMIERLYETLTQHAQSVAEELSGYAEAELVMSGNKSMPSMRKALAVLTSEAQDEQERINQALQVLDEKGQAGIKTAVCLWCAGDPDASNVLTTDMGIQTLH